MKAQDAEASLIVSVIIPCYNQAQYLPKSVESVLAQTFRDFEIIIVDDGSPDNTVQVAEELIAKHTDARIRLIRKANGGIASARNFGISASKGHYLLPLDADDQLMPNFLEKALEQMSLNDGIAIAFTDIQHFGARTDVYRSGPYSLDVELVDNRIPSCSLFKKEMFEALGGYDESFRSYEDWDFWIRALAAGWKASHIPEPLFCYRKRQESDEGLLAYGNRNRKSLLEMLRSKHSALYQKHAFCNSPWRTLVCVPFFHPSIGGAERAALDLVTLLVQDGWDVDVLTGKLSERTKFIVAGARIIEHSGSPHEGNRWSNYKKNIRNKIESGRYGRCLLFADPENWVMWGLENAKVPRGTQILLQPLINNDGFGRWSKMPKTFNRVQKVFRKSSAIAVLTESGVDALVCKESGAKSVRIPNAVAPPQPQPGFRIDQGISNETFLMLHVANLWPVKNHLGLLEAVKKLDGDWCLLLLGGGAPDSEYEKRVLELAASDSRIRYLGQKSAQTVASAMAESDLVLLSSYGEVAPLCLLEAMSHGTPWLASLGTGGAHDYAGGVMAPVRSFHAVIETLRKNPGYRKQLGILGRDFWLACHRWDTVGKAWQHLFNGQNTESIHAPSELLQRKELLRKEFLQLHLGIKSMISNPGKVSFCIISGGQRQQKLERLVASIRNQGLHDFEIIIAGICVEIPGTQFLKHRFEAQNGKVSELRNAAAKAASGEFLVFCDDDIILGDDWAKKIIAGLMHADLASGRLLNPDGTRHWDWAKLDASTGTHRMLLYGQMDDYLYLTSGLFAARRHVWEYSQWNIELGFRKGEDVDFSQRAIAAGFRVVCCPDAVAQHDDQNYTQTSAEITENFSGFKVTKILCMACSAYQRGYHDFARNIFKRALQRFSFRYSRVDN